MRKQWIIIGYFFMYSIYDGDGKPIQISVEVKDMENRVICDRVREATIRYAKDRVAHMRDWKVFSTECEPYSAPKGMPPR